MYEITEKYRAEQSKFDDFRIKAEVLVREFMVQHAINYHKIESRIKDPNKLDEKIIRKNDKYKSINEITDLVGIRIITYFEDEADKTLLSSGSG
jgi:ppGpp synthetase/RelA/SpoT-type nucleotidyltranferase